jgi:hypothetical protein
MGQKQSKKGGSSGGKKGKKGKGKHADPEPTPEPIPVKVVDTPKPTVEIKPTEKPVQLNNSSKPKEEKKTDDDEKGTVADVLCEEMNKQNAATKVSFFFLIASRF